MCEQYQECRRILTTGVITIIPLITIRETGDPAAVPKLRRILQCKASTDLLDWAKRGVRSVWTTDETDRFSFI